MSTTSRVALIIDDDWQSRQALRATIQDMGWHVLSAERGEAGLVLLRTRRVQLVILALELKGLDGWHFLTRIGCDTGYWGAAIVVTTTLDRAEVAPKLPGVEVLEKPIDEDAIRSLVKRVEATPPGPPADLPNDLTSGVGPTG